MAKVETSTVAAEFGRAIVNRDFDGAYALLTDGFRDSTPFAAFRQAFADVEANASAPDVFECRVSGLTQKELWALLAKEGKWLPAEVDPASFRQWTAIRFAPGPDQESDLDVRYDCWIMVVREKGRDRIGYFEIKAAA
jgi:hypothetical protein